VLWLRSGDSPLGCTALIHYSQRAGGDLRKDCLQLCVAELKHILGALWAFSVALDISTVEGTVFIDVRIRVRLAGKINNAHALAVPLKDTHTGEVMFKELSRLLEALCEN
jgi:hypothetical protein